MKKQKTYLVPVAVYITLFCLALLFSNAFAAYRGVVAGVAALAGAVMLALIHAAQLAQTKRQQTLMDAVFLENASIAARIIQQVSVPCAVIDGAGRIIWKNEIFKKIYDEVDVRRIEPGFDPNGATAALSLEIAGGTYQVMCIPIQRDADARKMVFQYWVDRTEAAHYQRLLEEQRPYVALIYVDNYEELASDTQFQRASVLTEVERLIAEMTGEVHGIYRRYESGRFLVIFEASRLVALESARFPLLEKVHAIDTGTGMAVSLSVAVGAADRIATSDESARLAMELALGRGGDQAVVKRGTNYSFYGGKRQLETMQSRVKMRLFAKALRQLFENAGDVFIVGHRRADMDCIGAAFGVAACAKKIGSRAYVVLDESNVSIERALELVKQNRSFDGQIITPEQAERFFRPNSVLVVIDTQRVSTVIAPQLLERADRLVLIDHHRRSPDRIENTTLYFLESRASSTSELVSEMIQYFEEGMRPSALICAMLLAGITVDTKHFAFNVGSRTFEAAAYLRKNGADIGIVKQMFQDDMESFGDCANTVRSADILSGGVAIATVDENVRNAGLIAAKSADELIGIRDIEAAFVIGRQDGAVSVSGRSLGKVNVQLICEKMGGGGHLTMAGAQLGDIDLDEAEARVRASIEQYIEEGGAI